MPDGIVDGMTRADVVVIGGTTMDLHARSAEALVPRTSNPGSATLSPGGVGRNVAENLGRLGTPVALVSVVGDDGLGDEVLAYTAGAGVDVSRVRRRAGVRTPTYNALLDADGELVAAVVDMVAMDEIGPLLVEAERESIAGARLLVVDGNLPAGSVAFALDVARQVGTVVAFDPVSVPKATRIAGVLDGSHPVDLITPNPAELAALAGLPTTTEQETYAALDRLHERGCRTVWLSLGAAGSLISTGPADARERVRLAPPSIEVRDVTGAGDAMMGAFCHAVVRGAAPREAARYGQAAAALTAASSHTVRPDLSDDLIRSLLA